jgi:hypothetical protein
VVNQAQPDFDPDMISIRAGDSGAEVDGEQAGP